MPGVFVQLTVMGKLVASHGSSLMAFTSTTALPIKLAGVAEQVVLSVMLVIVYVVIVVGQRINVSVVDVIVLVVPSLNVTCHGATPVKPDTVIIAESPNVITVLPAI